MTPARIVVGIAGGIAAFKVAAVVSRLVQQGHRVDVVLTENARWFSLDQRRFRVGIGLRLAIFSMRGSRWEPTSNWLREQTSVLIAPATAQVLRLAASQGLWDDLLATLYLTCECPVLVAPAMSSSMWDKAAVQRNVKQLEQDGVHFIGPESGWLSCRKQGHGRMAEPEALLNAIESQLGSVAKGD